jgi:hypothetical protein
MGSAINRRPALIFSVAAACLLASAQVHADPLPTRNENPLLAPFGIPSILPARLPSAGEGEVAATLNWSNSIAIEADGSSLYHMDGEAQELRIEWVHAFADRLAVRAEVPWRRLSGGTLDSTIENWHELWNLPNGDRDKTPRDQLLIQYVEGENLLLQVDKDASGIGDIPVSLGYQFVATPEHAVAAWLSVKAPTGRADDLSGSGAMDVAWSLAAQTRPAERWQLFAQADFAWLGNGDVLPQLQETYVWSAMAGVTWNAWRGLDLTVQVDANSKVFDAPTNVAGDAVVLGFGGSYRTPGGWRFDLGFGEDLTVDAAPDFTLVFGVRRGY